MHYADRHLYQTGLNPSSSVLPFLLHAAKRLSVFDMEICLCLRRVAVVRNRLIYLAAAQTLASFGFPHSSEILRDNPNWDVWNQPPGHPKTWSRPTSPAGFMLQCLQHTEPSLSYLVASYRCFNWAWLASTTVQRSVADGRAITTWFSLCRFLALWRHLQGCQQGWGPSPDKGYWRSCPRHHAGCHRDTDRRLSQVRDLSPPSKLAREPLPVFCFDIPFFPTIRRSGV